MNLEGLYYKFTQVYHGLNDEKRKLILERDKIQAKLELVERMLIDINDILCKHGKHVYEHFEEGEEEGGRGNGKQ